MSCERAALIKCPAFKVQAEENLETMHVSPLLLMCVCVCVCLEQGRGSKQQKCDPVTLHWYKLGCRALLKLYVFGVACLKAEKKRP